MTTASEVIADVRSKVGQRIDIDGQWGGQCMDLVEYVASKFGKRLGGNAIDGLNRAKALGWPVVYDAPGVNPKKGAIFVMNVQGHNFGHIGLVTADSDGITIKTLEQNVDGYSDNNRDGINDQLQVGGVVREMSRGFDGVIGWFYPPYSDEKKGSNMGAINHNGETYSGLTTHFNENVMYSNLSPGVVGYDRMKIDRIVIHHNATTNKNVAMATWYESNGNWTSAHYEIADNEIWGCVGEQYCAFHSGDEIMNRRSIGLEHVNATGAPNWTISEATYQTSAKLIADIAKRYNIPIDAAHIIPHKQVSATACPGGIDMAKLIRMAQEVAHGGTVAKSAPVAKTGSFRVKVSVTDLNIRKSASLKAGKNGMIKPGVYTITETKSADGYEWGKLKSGAGWIALKYTKRL